MKKIILLSLVAITILTSCSTSMKQIWTRDNYEGNEFKNILVFAIAKNKEEGTTFENAIVEELKKKGINATNSLSIIPATLAKEVLTEVQIESEIKKGNYDGIMVSLLVDVKTKQISVSGPEGYGSQVSNSRTYINNGLNFTHTGENYREEKSYVLETTLFDTSVVDGKETIVWKGQSSVTEPTSFYSGSKEYAETLIKTLANSKIIR